MFLPFGLHYQFEFHLLGVSYKKTPLEIREQFCIADTQLDAFYSAAKNAGIDNLLLISTCNRTELYSFTSQPEILKTLWLQYARNIDAEMYCQFAFHLKNHLAIKHLFEVAGGIDSQILGDFEVLGQVKYALRTSQKHGLAQGNITRLVEQAIRSSKEIKTTTDLSSGASSIASASVIYLQKNVANLMHKKVLLVGTGKIGRITCSNLIKQVAAENITVINRTYETAKTIANEFGLQIGRFEDLNQLLATHDIIVVATGAAQPVINKSSFVSENIQPKVLLDLSVPRNIAADVADVPDNTVVNVDQLEDLKNDSLEKRVHSLPKAKQLIHAYILAYYGWLHATPALPVIEKMVSQFQAADLQQLALKLKEAGIITYHEETPKASLLLKYCITHLKENYHKPETERIMKEAFQSEITHSSFNSVGKVLARNKKRALC